MPKTNDDYDYVADDVPYWGCEWCRYESMTRPKSEDREAFYKRIRDKRAQDKGALKCPGCKRMSFLPKGF